MASHAGDDNALGAFVSGMVRLGCLAGFLFAIGSAAAQDGGAQLPSPQAEAKTQSGSVEFDPTRYGMATFDDPGRLYEMLTQEGRCPPKQLAERKQPCAFIFYLPSDDQAEGFKVTFKPVFMVTSKDVVWAMHDGKFKRIAVEDLYYDEPSLRGGSSRYVSVAVVGNEENAAACAQGRPCLSDLVSENMFLMYRKMPDSVADVFWSSGPTAPGVRTVR